MGQVQLNSQANLLSRGDMAGVVVRCLVVLVLMGLAFAGLQLVKTQFFPGAGLTFGQSMVLVMIIAVAMICGMVFSEYPRGGDLALARMGLATFCRTGVPLVVLLVIERYSNENLFEKGIAVIILMYGVGLFSSIILSLLPLRESSTISKVEA